MDSEIRDRGKGVGNYALSARGPRPFSALPARNNADNANLHSANKGCSKPHQRAPHYGS